MRVGFVENVLQMRANGRDGHRQLVCDLLEIRAVHDTYSDLGFGFGEPVEPTQQRRSGFGLVLGVDYHQQRCRLASRFFGVLAMRGQDVNDVRTLSRWPRAGERMPRPKPGTFTGQSVVYGQLKLALGVCAACDDAS